MTGPTGSGKTTTLYSALRRLNTTESKLLTAEDPVEYEIDGIIQVPVNDAIGNTFERVLRAFLRQDPDVLMIGEIRDLTTAHIAIHASLTGHLVFSTLHTNDAVGGITRLLDMNIEPFLVGSSVRAFIAQRLVRRLCPHCSQPAPRKPEELAEFGFPVEWAEKIRRPVGCEHCRLTGYAGRTALFEICMMTSRMQELIQNRASAPDLRELALREGMIPLRRAGWLKVADGVTSVEEVLRVTTSELEALDE